MISMLSYNKVRKWSNNVDIFDRDVLLFPLCQVCFCPLSRWRTHCFFPSVCSVRPLAQRTQIGYRPLVGGCAVCLGGWLAGLLGGWFDNLALRCVALRGAMLRCVVRLGVAQWLLFP